MKKIISCTLAATITGTSFAAVNPNEVKAIENNNDSLNNENISVEIESIEKI